MEQLKQNTLLDIYTILFCTKLNAPGMYEHLCKAYIQKMGVPFSDIVDTDSEDEERNFYNAISTEYSPSFTQFCYKYERFFNWELFSIKQDCDAVFSGVKNAIDNIKPDKKVRLEDVVVEVCYIDCESEFQMNEIAKNLELIRVKEINVPVPTKYANTFCIAIYDDRTFQFLNHMGAFAAPRYKSSDLILPEHTPHA